MSEFMKFNPGGRPLGKRETTAHSDELLESYNNSTYAWKPGMDMILRMSKSSFNDFGMCPQQYKYKHIYNLPEEGDTEDMVCGNNLHWFVEYFWDYVDTTLPTVMKHIEDDNHFLAKEALRSTVPEPPEPYRLGEEAIIQKWLDWQFNRLLITEGKDWKAVGNEVSAHARIEVDVDGEMIPVHLRGYVDSIFPDGDGGFVLMELKTGKWKPSKAKSMREEMQFYRLMLEEGQHTDYLPITHWAWEFPNGQKNDGVRAEWELEEIGTRKTKYAPRTVMNNMKKLVQAHINDDFPAKPVSWSVIDQYEPMKEDGSPQRIMKNICEWCSFVDICPKWTGVEENEEN